ncbi:helix-turn-helix domain-containing protein [Olivibacter oleidegradans]|uniref:Helix-turn-helix domain-containing protein n=2 Tax=Sphingobacteriaceae TaxID=84566 RepID=A0ABV6HPG0_9SPHI|nr:helix-turn-helix domain-containing protein [Olivibacter sp. 47]MCL4640378.1 helix-turn-helix domain-containing protein [Olivibacter sp. UJ_SKK_5.1]MDM8173673.1 helix-turn-helix domain-containing protein [Olivibacter sp. 47]QEL03466.1 helix-turn-helix domain-containing protein [Olivibacter sp. LS-1]
MKRKSMLFVNNTNECIGVHELDKENINLVFDVKETDMTFIWNTGEVMNLTIDRIPYQLKKHQIIFLTEFHKIDAIDLESARMVRFNQPFYCIVNHDNEVGSKGFLFFGASGVPIVSVDERNLRDFEISWEMFSSEIRKSDLLQQDMLQAILKRMLILSARILTHSTNFHKLEKNQSDIVREFNYLVERHFAEHHDVAYYASRLNKSPKTLSNLFSIVSNRSPLNIIHDRIMIHARRQINYSNRSIKEIAYELGYEDVQTFSRFFKSREGMSPVQYREKSERATA